MNMHDALNVKYKEYHDDKIIEIKSSVAGRERQCWLRTAILDHGTGIRDDASGNVFDPFFTTKLQTDSAEMGLSVCYSIIKEYRGEIYVETESEKWTQVCFDLPCFK
ncbi:MAG: ATP-binding protein [Candidatus Neomarinimicrobiota bacterium]